MKKLIGTLLMSTIFIAPITYADKHHFEGMGMGEGMGGMMMNQDQMMGMHIQMQKMREQIEEIRNEKNKVKRQELMNNHLASMQEGMQMMNKGFMRNCKIKADCPQQDTMTKGMGKKNKSIKTDDRIEMMEQRMGMMQIMMDQILEHKMLENEMNKSMH